MHFIRLNVPGKQTRFSGFNTGISSNSFICMSYWWSLCIKWAHAEAGEAMSCPFLSLCGIPLIVEAAKVNCWMFQDFDFQGLSGWGYWGVGYSIPASLLNKGSNSSWLGFSGSLLLCAKTMTALCLITEVLRLQKCDCLLVWVCNCTHKCVLSAGTVGMRVPSAVCRNVGMAFWQCAVNQECPAHCTHMGNGVEVQEFFCLFFFSFENFSLWDLIICQRYLTVGVLSWKYEPACHKH